MSLFRRTGPRDADMLGTLFRDDSCGLLLLDAEGRITRANDTAANWLGITLGGLLRERLPAAAAFSPGRLRGGAATVQAVAGTGAEQRNVTLTFLPLASGGGLVRIADRSHERGLEEKLAQSQRLQEVGQLAGGIAHDFNNLLTVILGGVDEVLSRTHDVPDREDLEQVRTSAQRGAALVAQLLAFGRQQTLMPSVHALNEAIRRAAALLDRVLGEGIRLRLVLETPERLIRVDPTQFDQVLVNLAVNARDAMAGQGELTIASGHRMVLQPEAFGGDTVAPGRYVTFEVRDTGAGIPPDVLPRIFEPFYTTKRDRGGTGLGLSTVHGIVRQSGGHIAVESRPGEGTTIRILLPRHEEALSRPQPAAAVPAPARLSAEECTARGDILLVEDEAPVRRLAERALSRQGWQVTAAACAQDALELLDADGAPAHLVCVVSDVVMPGMDGPSLVRALRQTRPHLPAVLVSGYADASLRAQLASEHVCFLSKPFAMADLTAAVAIAAQ